jgi:hypothetical protein
LFDRHDVQQAITVDVGRFELPSIPRPPPAKAVKQLVGEDGLPSI